MVLQSFDVGLRLTCMPTLPSFEASLRLWFIFENLLQPHVGVCRRAQATIVTLQVTPLGFDRYRHLLPEILATAASNQLLYKQEILLHGYPYISSPRCLPETNEFRPLLYYPLKRMAASADSTFSLSPLSVKIALRQLEGYFPQKCMHPTIAFSTAI
jgi:hypothetical protein